jgi:hypothetical protein
VSEVSFESSSRRRAGGRRRRTFATDWLTGAACALLLAAAAAGCGDAPPSPGPGDDGEPPGVFAALSAAQTAAALADPERVDAGVRSLVANLGLGVYRGSDLEQLHAGSERGPEDFWLYDFQLAALSSMAHSPVAPFLDFFDRLAAVGYDGDASSLLARYRSAYAGSAAFLPAMFAAQALDLGAAPEELTITPLQEWLLLLDGFVPPNAATTEVEANGVPAASGAVRPAVHRCAGIVGAGASNWGQALAPSPPGMVDPTLLAELMTALHMMTRRLEPAFGEVHERHPQPEPGLPPDTVDFSATVAFPDVPVPLIVCNPSLWQHFLMPTGGGWGLQGVLVWWEVPDSLAYRHGEVRAADGGWFPGTFQATNDQGVAALTFHARDEEAEGRGIQRTELAQVTATFDPSLALAPLFAGIDPLLFSYLPRSLGPFPPHEGLVVIEISWHEEAPLALSAFAIEHPLGWEKAYGLAGAVVGFIPWDVRDRHNEPTGLLEPVLDACGFWTQGLELDGEHVFEVSALHDAGEARMRLTTAVDEDGETVAIAFAGSGAANPVSSVASMARVKAETGAVSGDHTSAGPAMLVIDVPNPRPGELLEIDVSWSIDGDKHDEHDYADWWADASLWLQACGEPGEGRTLFMIDHNDPEPSVGTDTVRTEEERIQLHLLLDAGLFAQAYEQSNEPDVVSSARVQGELLISVRSATD